MFPETCYPLPSKRILLLLCDFQYLPGEGIFLPAQYQTWSCDLFWPMKCEQNSLMSVQSRSRNIHSICQLSFSSPCARRMALPRLRLFLQPELSNEEARGNRAADNQPAVTMSINKEWTFAVVKPRDLGVVCYCGLT